MNPVQLDLNITVNSIYFWIKKKALASNAGEQGSIPGRDKPKSVKQVVTAPLPNARQQVWVSWILEDGQFKGLAHVTVGVAR